MATKNQRSSPGLNAWLVPLNVAVAVLDLMMLLAILKVLVRV